MAYSGNLVKIDPWGFWPESIAREQIDMTHKENILNALRQTLRDIFCRNIEEDEKQDLETLINHFVVACDSNFSTEDIISEFSTQEKLMNLFNGFREIRSGADAPTIH